MGEGEKGRVVLMWEFVEREREIKVFLEDFEEAEEGSKCGVIKEGQKQRQVWNGSSFRWNGDLENDIVGALDVVARLLC